MNALKSLILELFQFRSWNWRKYLDSKNKKNPLGYCQNPSGWWQTDMYIPLETIILQAEKRQISQTDMKMIKALKPVKA